MMPNSDWWDRAKQPPRSQPIEVRKRELLCTLHRDAHEITLEKRDVPAMGEELILSVNRHWRRMRVFKNDGQPIEAAIAETLARLSAQGWRP